MVLLEFDFGESSQIQAPIAQRLCGNLHGAKARLTLNAFKSTGDDSAVSAYPEINDCYGRTRSLKNHEINETLNSI